MYVLFALMAFALIQRIFSLQIIHGEEYEKNFSLQTVKERSLKSTRGNIYDRNGNVLASNRLTYSVTLEDVRGIAEQISQKYQQKQEDAT